MILLILITLVTKPFGGRVKCLSEYITVHLHKHKRRTIPYTESSYFQLVQAYDMNSTHVRLMKVFGSTSSSRNWEGREIVFAQKRASNVFAAWLFKTERSGAVPHLPVQRCCSLWIRTVSGFHVVHADAM